MKQSKATTFILIILILTYMIINVNAKEENTDKNSITLGVYSSSQAYAPGDSVNLKYTLMSEEDKKIDLFRIQIDYDPIALTFDRVNTTDNISASIFKTVEQDGKVTFLYLKKDKELLLESGKESEIFDVVFKSNKDVTTPYEVSINSGIVSIIDDKIKVLKHSNPDATALKFDYPEPEVTSLEKLVPSVGELIPSFSPENLNYSMQVSNKVSDLTFEAVPQNEDGIVKVNRKTMKTAGFTTDFKITSYAQDGTKSIYTVSVYRQTKEESEESSQIEESSESDSSSSKSESKASS
ncbi:MAG: cadherin-like beta sandwich domain-containing protein, partial [Clostridia bacterium]|nr:cadherin-like beta sandwich domain-containing protein [Clostridia bacterium]